MCPQGVGDMGHCSCISAIDAGAANGGRIARGIDFLGYHFLPPGLALAKQVITNFLTKTSRLYEQERHAGRQPDNLPLLPFARPPTCGYLPGYARH